MRLVRAGVARYCSSRASCCWYCRRSSGHAPLRRLPSAQSSGEFFSSASTASVGRSDGASGASGVSRRRDARTVPTTASRSPFDLNVYVDGVARRDTLHRSLSTQASRRSTFVVGARAATTAAACSGAARVRSINWPARNTSRRTATPWSTTSTRRRDWSPACSTQGRWCKHSCFISSRRSAACALSEQSPLLARSAARRSRSCARGGGTCPCAPTR